MPMLAEPETESRHDLQESAAPSVRAAETAEKEAPAATHQFAFVIHPLSIDYIHKHPGFRWTRFLPDALVERLAALRPPMLVSRIRGGQSPATGQRIEGYLFALSATPRQLLSRHPRFTYAKLNRIARKAEALGARILGLGAFTKVVGDAGVTVAEEADIAVTSGNSLSAAATLETAKQALKLMGVTDLTRGRAMVVGATGAIGSVCSRLLAMAVRDVVLVSIEPERLETLRETILAETPEARVYTALKPGEWVADCDLIITATSAFGERVIDISRCKPGAVICDVALPPDLSEEEAAVRPDVLVVESGEVLIPGPVDFGYDIGLPPGTAYACLAEAALLAMEGRFEDYTLGRNIETARVKEIYRMFRKHEFRIAPLRSFGRLLTEEILEEKRALAKLLREEPVLLSHYEREATERLAKIPPSSKGVKGKAAKNGAKKNGFLRWRLPGLLAR